MTLGIGAGRRWIAYARRCVAVVLLALGLAGYLVVADEERMLASLQRYGGAPSVFIAWRELIEAGRALETPDRLRRVNDFFNRRIQDGEDRDIWGQADYWATPIETLAKGRGDCEDFAIAKYFTLLATGVPNEKLRLVYVKARIGGPASSVMQAHMVLAYYPEPEAEPLILDSLLGDIRPASRRPDLLPMFSFNSRAIWSLPDAGGVSSVSSVGRLTRWQDLLRRARAEGMVF